MAHRSYRLPDKGRAIKGLVVCHDWDLKPLDLPKVNGPALGCYQLSPDKVGVVWLISFQIGQAVIDQWTVQLHSSSRYA